MQQTDGSKQIDGSTINALHKHTYCVQMNRSATGFKIFRLQENGHWSVLVVEVGTTCWCQILGPDELLQLLVTMGVNKNWWAREADAAWCCQPIYIQHLVYRNIVIFVGYTRSGYWMLQLFFNSPHPCQVHIAIIAICRFPLISASALPYIQSMQQREM